jgi:hypothetical protein
MGGCSSHSGGGHERGQEEEAVQRAKRVRVSSAQGPAALGRIGAGGVPASCAAADPSSSPGASQRQHGPTATALGSGQQAVAAGKARHAVVLHPHQAQRPALLLSPDTASEVACQLGVRALWVAPSLRRQGWATRMLDVARCVACISQVC